MTSPCDLEVALPEEQAVLDRLKQLVLCQPLLSAAAVAREYLREHGEQLLPDQVHSLLTTLAEQGMVDLTKEGNRGGSVTTVRPSLRALREEASKQSEAGFDVLTSPEPSFGDTICKQMMVVQELPHHFRENVQFPVVVTHVKNPESFWFNIYIDSDTGHPVYFEAVEQLMEKMDQFYSSTPEERWRVETVTQCPAGTVLAALYQSEGYHRVLVKEVIDLKRLKLFYIDHGTTAVQKLRHVRFLKAEFASLPGQAIRARLWGVEQPEGRSRWGLEARARVLELLRGMAGSVVAEIVFGVEKRNTVRVGEGQLLVDRGLTLRLVNVMRGRQGTDLGSTLVAEGLARWEQEQGLDRVEQPISYSSPLLVGPTEQSLQKQHEKNLERLLELCKRLELRREEDELQEVLGPEGRG